MGEPPGASLRFRHGLGLQVKVGILRVRWLFEQGVFEDGNPERTMEIVRAHGGIVAASRFVAVGGSEDELHAETNIQFGNDEPVFVYGSMNLMKWLGKHGRWPALAWYDRERLRCQSYYAHWGEFLLQEEYCFLPLAEVRRRRDWMFHTVGRDGEIFVRPDDNMKSFSGGVVSEAGFEQWWELANFYRPGADAMAVLAKPQRIEAEWRFVIANRKVVTGSRYRRAALEDLAAEYPLDAAVFAESVADSGTFEPHPVYVMDVCEVAGRYRLVEIGSVCCASLYMCDLEKVVGAVEGAA